MADDQTTPDPSPDSTIGADSDSNSDADSDVDTDSDTDADTDTDADGDADAEPELRRLASTLASEPHWADRDDVETLAAGLRSPTGETRVAAIEAILSLAEYDWPWFVEAGGVDVLLDALEHDDPMVRVHVARNAGWLSPSWFDGIGADELRVFTAVVDRLQDEPDPDVRRQALYEIGNSDGVLETLSDPPAAVDTALGTCVLAAITTALDDADAGVRAQAARSLAADAVQSGWLDAVGAIETTVRRLNDEPDSHVRRALAQSLGVLGSAQAHDPAVGDAIARVGGVDVLRHALAAADVQLRAFAGIALLRIHDGDSSVTLDDETLAHCYDRVEDALRADSWSYRPVRDTGIHELTFDHPAAFAPFQDLLFDTWLDPSTLDEEGRVHLEYALQGLGSYVDGRVLDDLDRVAGGDDEHLAAAARSTLESIAFGAAVQCEDDDAPDPAPGYDC